MTVESPSLGQAFARTLQGGCDALRQLGQGCREIGRPFQEITLIVTETLSCLRNSSSVASDSTEKRPSRKIRLVQLHSLSQAFLNQYSPSKEDIYYYLPGIGSVFGGILILNALNTLAMALIFKIKGWCNESEQENLGQLFSQNNNFLRTTICSFIRGLIALVPVIGGLTLCLYDIIRLNALYEQMMTEKAQELGFENFRDALKEAQKTT